MVVRYDHKKHYKAIASWFTARGLEAPHPSKLSQTGFVVDGRVAGWVYQTDSSVALIDCVIANPDSLPSARRQSLKVLAGMLVETAIAMGFPDVIFTSKHAGIQKLGVEMGFKPTDQKVYIMDADDDLREAEASDFDGH